MKQLRSAVFQPRAVPLAAWSRAQALAMTLSLGVCAWQRTAWPVVVSAWCLFACLLMLGRRAHTPSGRFGLANAVTCMRLLVLLTLGLPPRWLEPWSALTITLLVLALDLLDGSAQARKRVRPCGAHASLLQKFCLYRFFPSEPAAGSFVHDVF